ncbi:MAG: hypothetical protein WCG75_10120, partial [Armatimonadota bacterium]
ALSYLKAGDIARMQTVAWAVQWDPSGGYDFRGIDAAIQKTASKGILTVWLLQASPHPSSGWYPGGWSDWFLPKREIWPGVVRLSTAIAQHIKSESKKYSTLEPLFQLWNEPQTGKPGGSLQGRKGEWASQYHELLFNLVTDLQANGIPKSQIVGPAASSFGEATDVENAEFRTMMPPPEFDWLSECGYRDVHVRLSAGGAKGDLALVRRGMQASLAHVFAAQSKQSWPEGQKVMVSEFYVTPGDVGVPVGTDMTPYHLIAFDLLKASAFSHVIAWGLRPDEKDSATDPWARFGGVGDSLVKWRGGS